MELFMTNQEKIDNIHGRFILVFWIVSFLCFLGMTVYGIVDYDKSKLDYNELDYNEFTFAGYKTIDDPDGLDELSIYVYETEKSLRIVNLLTNASVSAAIDNLQPGEKLFCYSYNKGGTIHVAELKAEQMIISLDDHNVAFRNNGVGLMVIMPILAVVFGAFALRTLFLTLKKIGHNYDTSTEDQYNSGA